MESSFIIGKERGSLSTVSLSPCPPCLQGCDKLALPWWHTHRDGSPVPLQEVAQRGQEADGGRADEFPFCCTQAPLSLSNFNQSLSCNNRNLQLQRNQLTRVGFSQLSQSFNTAMLGDTGTAVPGLGKVTVPVPAQLQPYPLCCWPEASFHCSQGSSDLICLRHSCH